jgi:hypothetical protein
MNADFLMCTRAFANSSNRYRGRHRKVGATVGATVEAVGQRHESARSRARLWVFAPGRGKSAEFPPVKRQ